MTKQEFVKDLKRRIDSLKLLIFDARRGGEECPAMCGKLVAYENILRIARKLK
jgi:hypothetical protein